MTPITRTAALTGSVNVGRKTGSKCDPRSKPRNAAITEAVQAIRTVELMNARARPSASSCGRCCTTWNRRPTSATVDASDIRAMIAVADPICTAGYVRAAATQKP